MYIPLLWQHEPLPPARARPPYTTVAENAGAGAPSARRVPQRSSSGKSDLESAVSEPGSDDLGHCGLHVPDLRHPATALESQLSHGREGGKCCRERTQFAAAHSAVA